MTKGSDGVIFSHVSRLTVLCTVVLLVSCASGRYATQPPSGSLASGPVPAVASWYGPDFHGKPTSSGETFNMYAYTCAHKTYPFGTILNVTNISNNKSVQCTVNDRGPFVEGRDIDLSYASAKEIGVIGPGTARVMLEQQGRDASYIRQAKVQAQGTSGPYAIQIGAFAESINAVRLKVALRLSYGNVYIQEAEVKGETYYRVRIGNFDSMGQALGIAEKLGQEGYPTVVLRADVRL